MKCANEYEIKWWSEGKKAILGLDEAGRGPIAGPLVVAGVVFPAGYEHEEIYDSKKLSEKKRNQLFQQIIDDALAFSIEIVEAKQIDEENIYAATQNAMQRIVNRLTICDGVLSDAMPLPHCQKDKLAIVKGDQKSVSISAASILAKVTRDRIMYCLDELYPQYGFKNHKGYPTKAHLLAIKQYGIIDDIYRHSYRPVALLDQLSWEL